MIWPPEFIAPSTRSGKIYGSDQIDFEYLTQRRNDDLAAVFLAAPRHYSGVIDQNIEFRLAT